MDTSQYMSMFIEEVTENLQSLNESLLELEKSPQNMEIINKIFRAAHTIKGMAATMGYNKMATLTHNMEDILSKLRNKEIFANKDIITVMFSCLDNLEKILESIKLVGEEDLNIDYILCNIQDINNKNYSSVSCDNISDESFKLNEYDISVINQAINDNYSTYEIDIDLMEDTLLKSARVFLIVNELEENGEIIKSYPQTYDIENENFEFNLKFLLITEKNKEAIERVINGISEIRQFSIKDVYVNESVQPIQKEDEAIGKDKKNNLQRKAYQSVRVDLSRIDNLMDMVSELVIYKTRFNEIASSIKVQELDEVIEQVSRTTSDIQDLVMKIRMLPLEVVFNRFPRMIRDIGIELNKDISLYIEGEDTELDRTVIDEIGEPLVHLLRNAADHGIESTEERIKRGKSAIGTIKIIAYQEGTKAIIKVIDDGRGMDIIKIKEKAKEMGISTEGFSDDEVINLIFTEGFSTNSFVTGLSGRGVGMNVVKNKIASLGGDLIISSKPFVGSTFIISLPLTLQIIRALLIKVGEETFAISLGFVERVIQYNEDNIKKINNNEVLLYRDEIIPFVRLNERLDIDNKNENNRKYVVIVKAHEKIFGILVDSLIGQQEIVIKQLGKILSKMNEYIGATILGDGCVTLILDVSKIQTN